MIVVLIVCHRYFIPLQLPECYSDHVPTHSEVLDHSSHHQQEAANCPQRSGQGHPTGRPHQIVVYKNMYRKLSHALLQGQNST